MTSGILIGILGLVGFLVLLFLGLPISLSMLVSSAIGLTFFVTSLSSTFTIITNAFFSTFSSYTLAVAPLFMIMGELATESGLGAELYDAIEKWTGHHKGGLAGATQVVCALFGAICGNSAATTGMMSRIAYPEMRKHGYNKGMAAAAVGVGANLSIIIPPSLPLIQYAVCTSESIGKLFAAGITMGIFCTIVNIVLIKIICTRHPDWYQRSEKAPLNERIQSLWKGGFIQIVIVFALCMGTMFAGLITPTEAGAVGVFGMILVTIIFKRFTMKKLVRSLLNTLSFTAMLYVLLSCASVYSAFFSYTGIPMALGRWVVESDASKYVVLALITLVYLILGFFIEPTSMMLLTAPIFYPVMISLGYDGIWFGIYILMVNNLGTITPPVGIVCYMMSSFMPDVDLQTSFKSCMPYIASTIFCIVALCLFPQLATWLPGLMY